MDNHRKHILEKIEKQLVEDGFKNNKIYTISKYGMGDANSYFEALVDIKLEGKDCPTSQEVWEEMKTQLNFYKKELLRTSEEYTKLQNKIRDLEEHIKWLERK